MYASYNVYCIAFEIDIIFEIGINALVNVIYCSVKQDCFD